jgi:hypothetical protein
LKPAVVKVAVICVAVEHDLFVVSHDAVALVGRQTTLEDPVEDGRGARSTIHQVAKEDEMRLNGVLSEILVDCVKQPVQRIGTAVDIADRINASAFGDSMTCGRFLPEELAKHVPEGPSQMIGTSIAGARTRTGILACTPSWNSSSCATSSNPPIYGRKPEGSANSRSRRGAIN